MKVLLFNPDTEMALANGGDNYTSPLSVRRLATKLCLLPTLYSCDTIQTSNDVCILIDENISNEELTTLPHYTRLKHSGIKTIKYRDLQNNVSEIDPWGWNPTLRKTLLNAGVDASVLPSESQLSTWRQLAHRATTIQVHKIIAQAMKNKTNAAYILQHLPNQFIHREDALKHIFSMQECILKQPWSSSGRGVFFIKHGVDKCVEQIVNGTIAHQGQIIIESIWNKAIDFATEWFLKNGKAIFSGYSIFKNSDNGNYIGNIVASQEALQNIICKHCDINHLKSTVTHTQEALEQVIGKLYEGPLGVDMLCTPDGMINPCVEINLRRTMGHIAIMLWEQSHIQTIFHPGHEKN